MEEEPEPPESCPLFTWIAEASPPYDRWYACTIVIRMYPRSAEPPELRTRIFEEQMMFEALIYAAISGTHTTRHSESPEARTRGSAQAKC